MTTNDTRKVFLKYGTCSRTFFFLLNREFGHTSELEERSADNLAGGIMSKGYQCGMLWGSSLAAGAESFRRYKNSDQAIIKAIVATQNILASFKKRTGTADCHEITGCDLSNKSGMLKLGLKTILGGVIYSPCFNLANKWAPEAINAAKEGLSGETTSEKQKPLSCASEVAKRLGASNEEIVSVAGFAGGLGLSGNGCGALSAAIWIKTLYWFRNHPGEKLSYSKNPVALKIMETFNNTTNSEILCSKICKRNFDSVDDHTDFIKNGGCARLIEALSKNETE
jgi:hypothetical protein